MDIVTKIKPLRATYESLGMIYKIVIALVLISLSSTIFPQQSFASDTEIPTAPFMVFESGDHTEYVNQYVFEIESELLYESKHDAAVAKLQRQLKLNDVLKKYLVQKRSPLAEYSSTILQQNNWKKIIALSNAESTMCRRYIESLSNCWGVGGSDLWDMGDNLGEGVVEMNKFLNNSPRQSRVKYSQMNFEQMNGLYKQPPGDHWVYNNLEVYNELTALERSMK